MQASQNFSAWVSHKSYSKLYPEFLERLVAKKLINFVFFTQKISDKNQIEIFIFLFLRELRATSSMHQFPILLGVLFFDG